MPSASSAKSVKASSLPPADPSSATTIAKTAAVVLAVTPVNATTNSAPGTPPSSTMSCAANASAVAGGGAATAAVSATSVVAVENSNSNAVSTPIKQILVIIEHKIRNLEKRKTKLESYRAIQASGKELSADQKHAVAKYDEVMQCLDFARDLTKQMMQLSNNAEKEQKKLARREATLRAQAETLKIREVLTIQNILTQFIDAQVRDDFLNGANGAAKLEESDLNALEKFFMDVTIKRQESPADTPFSVSAQKAAELFSFTIDGRPKQYGETTFEQVRRIFQSIQDCGYFDRAGVVESAGEECSAEFDTTEQNQDNEKNETDDQIVGTDQDPTVDIVTGEIVQMHISQAQQNLAPHVDVPKFEAPSAAAVPTPAFPQATPLLQQQTQVQSQNLLGTGQIPPSQPPLQRTVLVPPVVATAAVPGGVVGQAIAQVAPAGVPPAGAANQIHGGHFPPTTVRAVEQGYYKQHQYIQQMRPLAEVIGSTNFFFLQESELDSPDLVASGAYVPNDGQVPNAVINPAGILPPQSPSTVPQPLIQSQQQQPQQQPSVQQQPPQIPLTQQPGIPQSQPTPNSAIPSQTFTNQSFPPIVPPQAAGIFPPAAVQNPDLSVAQQQPQMPPVVYQAAQQQPGGPAGIPMQSLIPTPQAIAPQHQQQPTQPQILSSMVDGQSVADVISHQATANIATLMGGPAGAGVQLPGYPPNKFPHVPQNPGLVGVHPVSVTPMSVKDPLDTLQQQQQSQQQIIEKHDELKESRGGGGGLKNDASQDWDAHEPHVQQKSHTPSMSRQDDESNQWSNDVTNSNSSSKHDWNSNFDNQNDSNTWKNISNDNYGGRGSGGRNNYPGSNNRTSGGPGRGGSGLRNTGSGGGGGGGSGGPPSNGFRGRSNNYQQQNRNAGMYFRNNDSFYQNQNGNGGGYGNKDSSGGNYMGGGGGGNNNYRSRGGPMPPNSRQQSGGRLGGGPANSTGGGPSPSGRNSAGGGSGGGGHNPNRSSNIGGGNMPTNPNTRPGRNNPGSAYGGNSRAPPPNNVRQQQDINA